MKIVAIKFNTNKLRTLISFVFSKIFNKVNLFIFPNLEKKKFDYNFNLKKNDVLIKTLLCGYCGTDKKILTYNFSLLSSAFLDTKKHKSKSIYFGHEIVGRVFKKGKGVKNLKINDKVILDSANRNPIYQKGNLFGGFSNFFVRNKNQLEIIDNKITNEKAILIEPMACCFGSIKKAKINKGDNILIIGAGIIGQGILLLLRHMYGNKINLFVATNSKVHLTTLKKNLVDGIIFKKDLISESAKILRTKLNMSFKNKILNNGYNIIFECSGSNNIMNKVLRISEKNSQIILVGMNMNAIKFDPTPIWHRNINIKGSLDFQKHYSDLNVTTLKYIHNLIKRKKIDVSNLKIKKVSSENWKEMFNNKKYNSLKKAIYFV